MTLSSVNSGIALLCLFTLLGSCGDESSKPTRPHDEHDAGDHVGGHAMGHGATDASMDEREVPCTADFPRYQPGLSVTAGSITVELVSVAPAPPRQKTPNRWELAIKGADMQPLPGATLVKPVSYMQVHNHYGRDPTAKAASEPGRYELAGLDFNMRGPWEVIFDVERAGAPPEMVRIKICVE